MIPIHELLNRIRWDPDFAKGNFELGYHDRTENRIILVPLKEVTFPPESPSTFHLVDPEGQEHHIPFINSVIFGFMFFPRFQPFTVVTNTCAAFWTFR